MVDIHIYVLVVSIVFAILVKIWSFRSTLDRLLTIAFLLLSINGFYFTVLHWLGR